MYYVMFVLSCHIRCVWLRVVDEIIVATRRGWSRWCLHVHIHVFVDFCILRIVSHTPVHVQVQLDNLSNNGLCYFGIWHRY